MNEKQKDIAAYSTISRRAFVDELDKIAEAILTATEDQDAPGAAEQNTERSDKPVVEVETNLGETNAVPSKLKAILDQVNATSNVSVSGPTKGENVAATQLAGDVHASSQVSSQPAKKISDAASEGDVEKKAALIKKILGL